MEIIFNKLWITFLKIISAQTNPMRLTDKKNTNKDAIYAWKMAKIFQNFVDVVLHITNVLREIFLRY